MLYQGKNSWQCARAASIEAKRTGKPGRYFRVLNCASEYGLFITHVRPGMGLDDAQVSEQERDRFRGHRGAAVSVDGELPAADLLHSAGRGDQLLGQDLLRVNCGIEDKLYEKGRCARCSLHILSSSATRSRKPRASPPSFPPQSSQTCWACTRQPRLNGCTKPGATGPATQPS